MKAILISTQDDDWEALYLDGSLYAEGSTVGAPEPERFWIELTNTYSLTSITYMELQQPLFGGNFPETLNDILADTTITHM